MGMTQRLRREAAMKIYNQVAVFVLTLISIGASGQCAKPEINPTWDEGKGQFRCIDPAAVNGPAQDDSLSPTGDKDYCGTVRDKLVKVCPPADDGKACRSKAKSIFNACYKGSKAANNDRSGSTGNPNQTNKTDASTCMTTFNQQQQACQSRRLPPPSPGQRSIPDTCLQDALAAQQKCLANSR